MLKRLLFIATLVIGAFLHAEEATYLTSSEHLHWDHDKIMLNVEGISLEVNSLKRSGSLWLATVMTDNATYCPRGHITCKGCGMCHTQGCMYFVKHCNLWK